MNYRIAVAIMFGLSCANVSVAKNPNFDPADHEPKITKARERAALWVESYLSMKIAKNPDGDYSINRSMISSLRHSPIFLQNSGAPSPCTRNDNTMAYVTVPFIDAIMLCKYGYDSTMDELAQILLHESFHVAQGLNGIFVDKVTREIGATLAERRVMQAVLGCTYLSSDYFEHPEFQEHMKNQGIPTLPNCK